MLSFNFLASLPICVQTELHMHERMCQAIIIIKMNHYIDIITHPYEIPIENIIQMLK